MSASTTAILAAILGGAGVLVFILVVIALNPEKVQIWASMIWRLVLIFWKGAEYRYVASDVAGHVNLHFQEALRDRADGLPSAKVQIRWAKTSNTVVSQKPGTLVIRMRDHQDRFRNILHASLAATPRLVAPTLRSDLSPVQSSGIDLELCRGLAERLGAVATTTFRVDVLDPALQDEPELGPILEKFRRLELGGLFVPVLIQELVKLGAKLPTTRMDDLAEEIDRFIDFLFEIADRDPGENVDLTFLGDRIKVHLLLVAHPSRKAIGIQPFHWRVGKELSRGVNTSYVLATESNRSFAEEVVEALDADRRLLKQKTRRIPIVRAGVRTLAYLVPFEKNTQYDLSEHLSQLKKQGIIQIGKQLPAIVIDVQDSYALGDADGLQVVIKQDEVAWGYPRSCRDHVAVGDQVAVEVIALEDGSLQTSIRRCTPSPIAGLTDDDLIGESVVFCFEAFRGNGDRSYALGHARTKAGGRLPARLDGSELEWGGDPELVHRFEAGDELEAIVTSANRPRGAVSVSGKRRHRSKWETIREQYKAGLTLGVSVLRVDSRGAFCEVEPGLVGFVPRSEFQRAGLEYADFEENLHVGQTLYVEVGRVVAGQKQRVNLLLRAARGDS